MVHKDLDHAYTVWHNTQIKAKTDSKHKRDPREFNQINNGNILLCSGGDSKIEKDRGG